MSLRFTRRPLLKGNTNDSVDSQPGIRGSVRRDNATLQFPGMSLPANLTIEIDGGAPVVANFLLGLTIVDIVNSLNTALNPVGGLAEDRGGYIAILSAAAGSGSSVKITASGGATDTAALMGLPVDPDPLAFAEGGDATPTPPGISEANPVGTAFATMGEDLTSRVLNRAVDALAYNADNLHFNVNRELAFPMVIDIDPADPVWDPAGGRLVEVAGAYTQVNLGGLAAVAPTFSDRIFLGRGLTNLSTLSAIDDYFSVTDSDGVEIITGGVAVHIAAVTHGIRVAGTPSFPDEVSPPASPVPDVLNWTALDGGNLMGVDFPKAGPLPVDTVLYRSAVEVAGHSFSADGVGPRDTATIAGAGGVPFLHDGDYEVESLIADDTLMLRARTEADRGELNPAALPLGNVTVSSGGEFAEDVWFTFEPPIPSGTSLRLVCGGGYDLASFPAEFMLTLMLGQGEQVDDLVQKVIREMKGPLVDSTDDFTADPFAHAIPGGATYAGESDVSQELLWRRITLQGAYDGQGRGGGGGYFVNVDWNPPEWNNLTPPAPLPGTPRSGPTAGGTFLADNQFQGAPGEAFVLDDVGDHLLIVSAGGPLLQHQIFTIIDYIDSENVVVEPGENNPIIPIGGNYTYEVHEDRFDGISAAHTTHVLQDPSFGRLGYVAEEDRTATVPFGHGFTALREVTTHNDPAVGDALDVFPVQFLAADQSITLPFDPSTTSNIRAFLGGTLTSLSQSVLKITESLHNDGWYVVHAIDGPWQRLILGHFGTNTIPTFTPGGTGRAHLYLMAQGNFEVFGPSVPGGALRVGNTFFEDAIEWGAASAAPGAANHLGVIGFDWRGESDGIVAWLNASLDGGGNPTFASYANGDAAVGTAISLDTFMPANGIFSAHTGGAQGWPLALPPVRAERGGYASLLVGETHAQDMHLGGGHSQGAPTPYSDAGPSGYALGVVQLGKDPSLVVVGVEGAGPHGDNPALDAGYVSNQNFKGKPAILGIQAQDWSMLQSGFLQFQGASYQEDWRLMFHGPGQGAPNMPANTGPSGGAGFGMVGGTYSELAGTARFSFAPQSEPWLRYYQTNTTVTRSGEAPLTEPRIMCRLGHPGQIFPAHDPMSAPSWGPPTGAAILEVMSPDFSASRSVRSSGFIHCSGSPLYSAFPKEDPSALIGQTFRYVPKGGNPNAAKGGDYVIINALQNPSDGPSGTEKMEMLLEIYNPDFQGATALVDDVGTSDTFFILGNRWHFGNVDVESWMGIGTFGIAHGLHGEPYTTTLWKQCGLLGGLPERNWHTDFTHTAGLSTASIFQRGVIGQLALGLNDYATGLATEDVQNQLGVLNLASRGPIANQGWHPLTEPVDKGSFLDFSFQSSEWVFRTSGVFPVTNDLKLTSDFSDADNQFAGALLPLGAIMLRWRNAGPNPTPESVRAWTRVTKTLRGEHYRLRVKVGMRWVTKNAAPADKTIAVNLTPAINVVGQNTEQTFTLAANTTVHQELWFESLEDLRDLAVNAHMVEQCIQVQLDVGHTQMVGDEPEEKLFIYYCVCDAETTDFHHGLLLNEGPVVSGGGFHLSGAAIDYKSYGPESAECYADSGYGDDTPWDLEGQNVSSAHHMDSKISPPTLGQLDGRRINIISEGVVYDGEDTFVDIPQPYWYWRRGKHDACFNFIGTLWSPERQVVSGGDERFPPMVGHVVKLDPPHNSVLTSLTVGVAFQRAPDAGPGWEGGIFYNTACDGGTGEAKPDDDGFRLELIRYWVMPTEEIFDHERELHVPPLPNPVPGITHGFAEVIYEDNVDVTYAEEPFPTADSAEQLCDSTFTVNTVQEERRMLLKYDLTDVLPNAGISSKVGNPAHVDRRQFAYALVIKCWGRGSTSEIPSLYVAQHHIGLYPGVHIGMTGGAGNKVGHITKFKFLGCTLGCQYTRFNP